MGKENELAEGIIPDGDGKTNWVCSMCPLRDWRRDYRYNPRVVRMPCSDAAIERCNHILSETAFEKSTGIKTGTMLDGEQVVVQFHPKDDRERD